MKKIYFKAIFALFIVLILSSKSLLASHGAGGELTWKCVVENGVSKYVFRITAYRDCTGANFSQDDQTIDVRRINGTLSASKNTGRIDANGNIIAKFKLRKDMSPFCDYNNGTPLSCAGGSPGSVEKYVYESDPIDFFGIQPPINGNTPFVFSWDLCDRNYDIINIRQDQDQFCLFLVSKMYPFYPNGTTVQQAVDQCFDNSPDFTEAPAALLFTSGQDFVFNNNASDMDLDNLYYDFADPVITADGVLNPLPSDLIFVNHPTFNRENPFALPTTPPGKYFSFNNLTGEYTFKPFYSGPYVTVIKVASYKCDQKVSEIFRDFQVKINVPTQEENSNKFPYFDPPFTKSNGVKSNDYSAVAGFDLLIPIVVRDSMVDNLSNLIISDQKVEFSINGTAMGTGNADTNAGCPYPPCAILTKNKGNYDFITNPTLNPPPELITNAVGEPSGYGYKLGANYAKVTNDTLWLYWPTSCSNLNKKDNCNGLTAVRYNFVVNVKDNFCKVPGKTIRTFSVNLLPPDFYLSPAIRCITYDQTSNQVKMDWGLANGDTNTFVRYDLYRGNTIIFTTTNRNIFTYTDLNPGLSPWDSTYYVRSINLCGVEDEVSPVSPMRLDANFYRSNQARLTWNPIRKPNLPDALNYRVYRSQTENPYNWVEISDADGNSANEAAIDNFDLCSDTTYYRVELYDDSILCTSYSTIDTIFHPTLIAAVSSDTVCMNTPTPFYINNLSGGIPPYRTVRWIGDEGFAGGNDDTTYYIYPTWGQKKFTFTVIDSKGCRLDIYDSTYVRQLPEFVMKKDSACPGAIINMGVTVNSPVPIDSIFWKGDYDAALDTFYFEKSGPYFDPFFAEPKWIFYANNGIGKFPVTLTLKDIYGCITTIVDTIKTGNPYIDIISDPSICYDPKKDSIKIIPRYLTKPYNTVQWIDNNNGQVLYQANDGKDAFPLSVVAGRRYLNLKVQIEDSKGCKGEAFGNFTLSPWLNFVPDSLCIGDVANLKIEHKPISDTANYTYLWELDANTISTEREPMHVYTSNGPKIITLLVTDTITGCFTFIKDTLTVRDPMQFEIKVDSNCAGDLSSFHRVLLPGQNANDVEWEWTIDEFPNVIPNNTIVTTTTGPDLDILLPPNDGKYRIILKLKDGTTGCYTSVDTILKVFNQPDIDFDVDSLNCAGSVTKFISKVISPTPGENFIYSWTGEDNFIDNVPNPIHVYPENGKEYYSVTLSVTNSFGCVVSKTKSVRVCDDKRTFVQVPQIFSPGREKNNTLSLNFTNVDEFEIKIYNRWGIEVFSSDDPNFVWDGKDKSGEYLLNGTYVYIVKASGSGKKNYLNKGTIAVLR